MPTPPRRVLGEGFWRERMAASQSVLGQLITISDDQLHGGRCHAGVTSIRLTGTDTDGRVASVRLPRRHSSRDPSSDDCAQAHRSTRRGGSSTPSRPGSRDSAQERSRRFLDRGFHAGGRREIPRLAIVARGRRRPGVARGVRERGASADRALGDSSTRNGRARGARRRAWPTVSAVAHRKPASRRRRSGGRCRLGMGFVARDDRDATVIARRAQSVASRPDHTQRRRRRGGRERRDLRRAGRGAVVTLVHE